jgi:alpha-galactosidase
MEEIADIPVDPARARIYAEGWQSWSEAGIRAVTDPPPPVSRPDSLAIDCQYRRAAPAGVFEGSGVLAVDPGDGSPVRVFGAPPGLPEGVPVIRAALHDRVLSVTADTPNVRQRSSAAHATSDAAERPPVTDGIPGALAAWADEFAGGPAVGERGVTRRPVPPVWCSWYQYFERATEDDILRNVDAMAGLDLPVEIVQIDDGYQACTGDWLLPSGKYADLPGTIGRIRAAGRRAGIWIAPWLVGLSSRLYADHPDWVVREPGSGSPGEPVWAGNVVRDDCAALDLTNPDAARYLRDVMETMRGWGVDYFKIDFCYAGAYDGVRHSPVPGVAAYRDGLRLIRAAIGPDALLVGCGAPLLPAVGFVDAMRIGPDIAATYEPAELRSHPTTPSQRNAARNVIARAWQHGRFWVNDPDCLMLRPGVERRADWAAVVRDYGGLRASSDGLDQLDAWGLETTSPAEVLIPAAAR